MDYRPHANSSFEQNERWRKLLFVLDKKKSAAVIGLSALYMNVPATNRYFYSNLPKESKQLEFLVQSARVPELFIVSHNLLINLPHKNAVCTLNTFH